MARTARVISRGDDPPHPPRDRRAPGGSQSAPDPPGPEHDGSGRDGTEQVGASGEGITIHLDELLAERGMTLTELSERVGITVVNLSVLKNGRARAIRFSTLAGLCAELGCQPGDVLSYEPGRSG